MADRKGSFLSDENIRKMCPSHFAPPASKTYQLFQTPSAPRGYKAQRPNKPYKMMEMMAKQQGVPYNALASRFATSIPSIENEGVAVISRPPNLKNVAQPQPTQSRAIVVPTGKPKSKLSGDDATSIVSLVSGSSYGSASSSVSMNPVMGLGNLGSAAQQSFNRQDRPSRMEIYKQFYTFAEQQGVDFKGTGLSYSGIDRVPGGLQAQSMLFGKLESAIYQALGMTEGQSFINQVSQLIGLTGDMIGSSSQADAALLPPVGEEGSNVEDITGQKKPLTAEEQAELQAMLEQGGSGGDSPPPVGDLI